MTMIAKQNFTTQKMDHTAIFITWGEFFKNVKYISKLTYYLSNKVIWWGACKSEDVEQSGQPMMATLLFDSKRICSVGHNQFPVSLTLYHFIVSHFLLHLSKKHPEYGELNALHQRVLEKVENGLFVCKQIVEDDVI